MKTLTAAVCELTGWADVESLQARLARVVPQVAAELQVSAGAVGDARFVRLVCERSAVNETYFFRHTQQLEAACAEVVRTFAGAQLTVWSAACSTGEEAWSLAMQLIDAGAPAGRFSVLGTDLSEAALAHARAGRYAEWSFRGVPAARRARCFEGRVVAERFRPAVSFSAHNLLSPPPMRHAHLIACRNALIYLSPASARRVLRHLEAALLPGGLLLLGTAEHHLARGLDLETVELGEVVVLRKPLPGSEPVHAERSSTVPPERSGEAPSPLPRPSVAPVLSAEPAIEAAWRALRDGLEGEARALADAAVATHDAEGHLVLATLDDAAGDAPRALEHLRRALYLDPQLIIAHVSQAALYTRLGRDKDAGRARANALRHLGALDPGTVLRAATPVTVRELKAALEVA